MITINGRQPDLSGATCEELLCQQYIHNGQLEDEADVVFLKIAGQWHQLYFDGGVVHWRMQDDEPEQRVVAEDDVFSYPLVDLGDSYGIKGQMFSDCQVMETDDGETVTLTFETGSQLLFQNIGDSTAIGFKGS
ncbi:MAG: hypothetical protein ABW090_04100 [Sedimenticola sp.]